MLASRGVSQANARSASALAANDVRRFETVREDGRGIFLDTVKNYADPRSHVAACRAHLLAAAANASLTE